MPRKKITEDVVITKKQKKSPAFAAMFVVIGIFVIVGAVLLGRSDGGQIDVNKAIEKSNQSLRDAGGSGEGEVETVREVFRNKPNGGLQPQEVQSNPQDTTAVHTEDATSSTTDAVVDDVDTSVAEDSEVIEGDTSAPSEDVSSDTVSE